jgi:hypothetical protein
VSDHVESEILYSGLHHSKPEYLGLAFYLDVLGSFGELCSETIRFS